MILNNCFTT